MQKYCCFLVEGNDLSQSKYFQATYIKKRKESVE